MTPYFRRQLAYHVKYHRDACNCAAHLFGIVVLFLAATLPLSLWPISAPARPVVLAGQMVLPVLIYWLALDVALGLAIAAAAVVLLSIVAAIVERMFERRKPSMADNPAHLLFGPMFVMAKLFIALGFRHALAAIIGPVAEPADAGYPLRRADP